MKSPPRPGPSKLPRPTVLSSTATRVKPASLPTVEQAPTDTLFKRRRGVLAIGVFVIVAVGSITGAVLKTRTQAQQQLAETGQKVPTSDTDHNLNVSSPPPNMPPKIQDGKADQAAQDSMRLSQIALLESRRAALLSQKTSLEQKIEVVRQKKRREQELETSRKQTTDAGR